MSAKLVLKTDLPTKRPERNDRSSWKVCLFGCSLDTGNRGVSALTASLAKLILGINPDALMHLMIGSRSPGTQPLVVSGREVDLNVVNYRLAPRSRISENILYIFLLACLYRVVPSRAVKKRIVQKNRWLNVLHEADFVGDIRGGDSFSDIYGLRRFVLGSIPRISALLIGKQLVLLPQTYGPYIRWVSRMTARFILRRSSCVMSRDQQSITLVRELVGGRGAEQRILFCPDVAFVLDSVVPESIAVTPPLVLEKVNRSVNCTLVGLNVNGLMYNGGYTGKNMFNLRLDYRKFLVACVERFMEISNVHVLLVPHTFGAPGNINSDPDACSKVIRSLGEKEHGAVHLLEGEYDQNEIKGIIGCCDFFIGSRMHSCIAALSQGVPTIGVAYSKKFKGVFSSLGFGDMVIDARTVNQEEAVAKLFSRFSDRNTKREELSKRSIAIQELVWSVFEEVLNGRSHMC